MDDLKPGNYDGQPYQRYLKIGWGHATDVADEVATLKAARQTVPAHLRRLAAAFTATKGDLDSFIKALPVDGYLGDALDTSAGRKKLRPLERFCRALIAALTALMKTDTDLTAAQRKNLTRMPRGTRAQRDDAFMHWRDLHFAKTLRDAVNRGVRYRRDGSCPHEVSGRGWAAAEHQGLRHGGERPGGVRGPDPEAGSECEDAMSEPTGTTGYPNARLRLRRTTHAPNAPDTDAALMLWLSGSRFRLRDEAGRSYPAILADVAPGRGLGVAARSIEDQMDAWSEAGRFWPPTEIYADLTADRATVVESGGQPWSIAAQRLAGLADEVFSQALAPDAELVSRTSHLGRPCDEYRFAIVGEEDGVPYRSEVRWWVAGPYLLRREVEDAAGGRRRAMTEVLELVEGVVTDDDLQP